MLIFQYKCLECNSIFEYLFAQTIQIKCVACDSPNVEKQETALFEANKLFCPKDRELDRNRFAEDLKIAKVLNRGHCPGC